MSLPTLIDDERIGNLLKYVEVTSSLPGVIVEAGVYKGGSLQRMALKETEKKIFGFDTFKGLPEKTEGIDTHKVGEFSDTSYASVKMALSKFKNVSIHQGEFPGCLDFEIPKVSLMHVDVDMYESTLTCMTWAHYRLPPGGIIICDDYGAPTCPGARLAVHEFLAVNGLDYRVISSVSCHIVLLRC